MVGTPACGRVADGRGFAACCAGRKSIAPAWDRTTCVGAPSPTPVTHLRDGFREADGLLHKAACAHARPRHVPELALSQAPRPPAAVCRSRTRRGGRGFGGAVRGRNPSLRRRSGALVARMPGAPRLSSRLRLTDFGHGAVDLLQRETALRCHASASARLLTAAPRPTPRSARLRARARASERGRGDARGRSTRFLLSPEQWAEFQRLLDAEPRANPRSDGLLGRPTSSMRPHVSARRREVDTGPRGRGLRVAARATDRFLVRHALQRPADWRVTDLCGTRRQRLVGCHTLAFGAVAHAEAPSGSERVSQASGSTHGAGAPGRVDPMAGSRCRSRTPQGRGTPAPCRPPRSRGSAPSRCRRKTRRHGVLRAPRVHPRLQPTRTTCSRCSRTSRNIGIV